MERELKRLAVVQTGRILAVIYAVIGAVMIVLALLCILVGMLVGAKAVAVAMLPMAAMALLYPLLGFAGGVVAAALYNLAARWVGGLRFTVDETRPPPATPAGRDPS